MVQSVRAAWLGSALIRNIKLFEQRPHFTPPPLIATRDQIRPTILQVRHECVAFARTDARHAGQDDATAVSAAHEET